MGVLALLAIVVASLVVFTITAVVRLSSQQAPIARDLMQTALPVLLAMLAVLVATIAMTPSPSRALAPDRLLLGAGYRRPLADRLLDRLAGEPAILHPTFALDQLRAAWQR